MRLTKGLGGSDKRAEKQTDTLVNELKFWQGDRQYLIAAVSPQQVIRDSQDRSNYYDLVRPPLLVFFASSYKPRQADTLQ